MSTSSQTTATDLDRPSGAEEQPAAAMPGNMTMRHRNTAILSVTTVDAPIVATSASFDEQLAETYARTGVRPGMLSEVAGISERRWWPVDVSFADAAAMAGAKAIAESGIDPQRIGLLIDSSVCRDHLEPSKAVAVHHQLDLSTGCLTFDLSNACLGFVNAMQLAATMIDGGQIEYALVVDGEGSRGLQELTLERLSRPDATADDVAAQFASLTLGSGAAAMVLGRADRHPEGHRLVAGASRPRPSTTSSASGRWSTCAPTRGHCSPPGCSSRSTSGARPRPTSTGATWTATSPTRSPRCTSRRSAARSTSIRHGLRAPSRLAGTSARRPCRAPWPWRPTPFTPGSACC